MKVLAIILIRGRSKGIKDKNIMRTDPWDEFDRNPDRTSVTDTMLQYNFTLRKSLEEDLALINRLQKCGIQVYWM